MGTQNNKEILFFLSTKKNNNKDELMCKLMVHVGDFPFEYDSKRKKERGKKKRTGDFCREE